MANSASTEVAPWCCLYPLRSQLLFYTKSLGLRPLWMGSKGDQATHRWHSPKLTSTRASTRKRRRSTPLTLASAPVQPPWELRPGGNYREKWGGCASSRFEAGVCKPGGQPPELGGAQEAGSGRSPFQEGSKGRVPPEHPGRPLPSPPDPGRSSVLL